MEITPSIEITEIGSDMDNRVIRFYDNNAFRLADYYESVRFETVYPYIIEYLSKFDDPLEILDIGSGTGRDAAWFADHGHQVMAIEPSLSMLDVARNIHSHPGISWAQNKLPKLEIDHAAGNSFDLILCNAVWMHIPPEDRLDALKRIKSLLVPGGSAFVSLRMGPEQKDRGISMIDVPQFIQDVQGAGLEIRKSHDIEDFLNRSEINWKAFQLVYL